MTEHTNEISLVSVVIPTYERPQFLKGAIQSALQQTYEFIEIVVVDDGSSEPYASETVSNFPDCVTCISHGENKGLSAARNTGIREASGEYIAFLDDDDRWHRTKLARQVDALERDVTAGLATCLAAAISPENDLIHCEATAPSGDCAEDLLVSNRIGTPSRVLVRQKCIDDIGAFDESLQTKQDWDFYLRLCQKWNVAAVKDHLCFRTVHHSMSSSAIALSRDKSRILEKHEKRIRSHGLWKQAQTAIAEEVGRLYLGDGELKKAQQHFSQSLGIITKRRILLYVLSYTTQSIVNNCIAIKRNIIKTLNCCNLEVSLSDIPGLD